MIQAQILRKQGLKQREIAEALSVSERTVRNHLKGLPAMRKPRQYKSKLDPHRDFIKGVIEELPTYNCVILLERLQKMGYDGGLSILREYTNRIRKKVLTEAVRRFETEPGLQAQVDWVELGKFILNGRLRNIYGFAMTLGFSRKSFVCFTTSMKQSVLHACHVRAFEYLGGVPKEILYDNMKTAFVADNEGRFFANRKLLAFAHHYGFTPKRCAVRRPQTKGKVERFIGYVQQNFMPRIETNDISLDLLNESVLQWLANIDVKPIYDLNESRSERFEREKDQLSQLPVIRFDSRELFECSVNRESFINFESNRYSVPPVFLGETLTLKVDFSTFEAEIYAGNTSIRKFELLGAGEKKKLFFPEDKEALLKMWERQKAGRLPKERVRSLQEGQRQEVEIRSPKIYESLAEAAS